MKKNPRILSMVSLTIISIVAANLFGGCLVKEKTDKPLHTGALTPPWDPAHFTAKRLDVPATSGSDSVFAVFADIARMDSLSGDRKDWKANAESVDTLHISQLFDTGFVFPQNPEATMPYGYDDSFRDDTLFRNAYGNGLFTQDHPCATTIILSGEFLHPAQWLKPGLKTEELIHTLGQPMFSQPGVLRYLSRHSSATDAPADGPRHPETKHTAAAAVGLATGAPASDTAQPGDSSEISEVGEGSAKPSDEKTPKISEPAFDVFEGLTFYFKNDSLFAAVLQKSQPCH